jgi:hypothetical protein
MTPHPLDFLRALFLSGYIDLRAFRGDRTEHCFVPASEPSRVEELGKRFADLNVYVGIAERVSRKNGTAAMDHDGHEELALSLDQAIVAQGGHASNADAVESPVGRILMRHRNSSIPRGRGPERPPLPREATT